MSFFDVLDLLFDESNVFEAVGLLLAISLLYSALFRRRMHSLLDPLVFVLALSVFSTTVLLLMGIHGAVSIEKIVFVAATLGLFYVGFLAMGSSGTASRPRHLGESAMRPVTSTTLAVLFCANFLVLAITYVFFGIPLLLESRLAQFSDSGGFGVLGRLAIGLDFSTLVLGFIALNQPSRARYWARAIVFQFVVSALLSGSKGSLLTGLFAWYMSRVYFTGAWSLRARLPRSIIAFLCLVLTAPLLVIYVQSAADSGGLASVTQRLATRFAAEGDGYAYFFGDDLIDRVARHDWIAPLRQVLVALRLAAPETSVNPGFEIVGEVLSIDTPSTGPNSRLPIYLLYFYGYGGILFAPFLGMALGWARNRLVGVRWRSPTSFALAAAVYLHFSRLEVDPQLTVSGLFGLALTLPVYWSAMALGGDHRSRRHWKRAATRVIAANGTSELRAHP